MARRLTNIVNRRRATLRDFHAYRPCLAVFQLARQLLLSLCDTTFRYTTQER
jgi:hypothetical protein